MHYAKTKKQQNGNVHNYTYYGCTKRKNIPCIQMTVREKKLEKQIETVLSKIQIPEAIHELLMSWVRAENEKQFHEIYVHNEANKTAYDGILKKISGLIDMRADGLISDLEFKGRKDEAEQEKERLMRLIKHTDQNVTGWLDTADKMFTFAELAVKRFQEGDKATQRGILVSLGWNLGIKDRKLDITRENWIEPVKRIAKVLNEELSRLEPVSSIYSKTTVENLLNSRLMCSLLDDVRNYFVKNPDHTWFPIVDIWRLEKTSSVS